MKELIGLKTLWQEISRRKYENIENLKAEITEDEYERMLEILPPLKTDKHGFYLSEFLIGYLTTRFYKEEGKYYAKVVNIYKIQEKVSK